MGSPVTGSVLARSRATSASLRSSARAEMLSHSYESSRAPMSEELCDLRRWCAHRSAPVASSTPIDAAVRGVERRGGPVGGSKRGE